MEKNKCMILGQAYSFADAKLTIAGLEMFSVSSVTATESQTKANNYGTGEYPASRGRGVKESEVSFDLSLKDVERLAILSPTGILTDLPMSISTLLLDNGVDKHEFTFLAFEFTSDGIEFAKDDTESRRSYSGICSKIESKKL